jgi:hypothetical protein
MTRDRLCAAVAGVTCGAVWLPDEAAAVMANARAARVDALVAYALRDPAAASVWPPAARLTLAAHLRQHLVLESMRQRELVRVVDAFAAAGVDVLLLKGAGLAYTVYAAPHLRPRDDTDLFIHEDDLDPAGQALAACGYQRVEEPDAELASTQRHYFLLDGAALRHLVDLHWRIAIPHVFAGALTFDEARLRAVPVPALGAAARTLGVADALLVACLHRVAHHHDSPDLLWLWDIHLLATSLEPADRARLVASAARAGICRVCIRGLQLARDHFGTDVAAMTAALEAARAGSEEASAAFLGGLSKVEELFADWRTLPNWRLRLRLLREHLFPPAAHMRALHGPHVFLPWIYLRRIVRGAPRWFIHPAKSSTIRRSVR